MKLFFRKQGTLKMDQNLQLTQPHPLINFITEHPIAASVIAIAVAVAIGLIITSSVSPNWDRDRAEPEDD
jgi:hypothetical protein